MKRCETRESKIIVTSEKQIIVIGTIYKISEQKICLLLGDNEEEWKADFHLQKSFTWKLIFVTE